MVALQISKNSSLAAICGRGDVDPQRPRAYGCYDTKVASWQMAAELHSLAVVGPTVEVTATDATLSTLHPHARVCRPLGGERIRPLFYYTSMWPLDHADGHR